MPKAPLEKLPLAARKDLRDNWENKKSEFEKTISELFGTAWTIEVNPFVNQAYATGSASQEAGRILASYIEQGLPKLQDYVKKYGTDGTTELNTVASSHILTIVPDDTGKVSYNACDIKDGKLRILFHEDQYGSWQSYAFENLSDAVDTAGTAAAPQSSSTLSFDARQSIKREYEAGIAPVKARLCTLTGLADGELTLTPNFEANYAALEEGKASGDWKKEIGKATLGYFEGLAKSLENLKFGEDEMLREGWQEGVEKKEVAVNAMGKLVGGGSYNETIIREGVLEINSTIDSWGSWASEAGKNIIDLL
ncbi:MAG: hypothetical protein MMC33_001742 [Icmadophila ericetorum]|nr:hypothetical protein [Icmadophila ericetorum]